MGIGRTAALIRRIDPADIGAGTPGADAGETLAAILGVSNASGANDIAMASAQQITFNGDVGLVRGAAGVLTVSDSAAGGGALRVGTATDATTVGSFASGLLAAQRMFFDAANERLDLHGAAASEHRVRWDFANNLMRLSNSHEILWTNSSDASVGTPDIGIQRATNGVLRTTDGVGNPGGALRLGSASDASTNGSFSAGLTGARRLFYAAATGVLTIFDLNGVERFRMGADAPVLDFGDDVEVRWSATNPSTGAKDVGLSRSAAGVLQVTDGDSGAGIVRATGLPRRLFVDITPVGNVGAGEDDLMTFSVPSGTLAADGDEIEVVGWGTTGPGSATKTLGGRVNGNLVGLGITTTGNNEGWRANMRVVRISSTAVEVVIVFEFSNRGTRVFPEQIAVSDLAANAFVVKFTGQDSGAVNDEMVEEFLAVDFWPAP